MPFELVVARSKLLDTLNSFVDKVSLDVPARRNGQRRGAVADKRVVCVCVCFSVSRRKRRKEEGAVGGATQKEKKGGAAPHTHTHTRTHDSLSVVVDVGANAIEHHDTVA